MADLPQQTLKPTPRPIPFLVDAIRGIASRHWMHQESSSIVDLCNELDRSFAANQEEWRYRLSLLENPERDPAK